MPYAIGNGGTADQMTVQSDVTTNLEIHVTQINKHQTDASVLPKTVVTNTTITSTTETKVTTDPASSNEAAVVAISVINSHATVTSVVNVRHKIGAGTAHRVIYNVSMKPGDKLEYSESGAWFHFDQALGVYTALATALSQTILTSGSGTYTPPGGCRAIYVRLVAGGGAGGSADGATTSTGAAGGGGAGGSCEKMISPPASSYSYAIGAGGTPGAAGNNVGGNGADTTFGSLTGKAGTGGSGSGVAGTAVLIVLGGAGGVAGSGGDINPPGEPGEAGTRLSAAVAASGNGGSSPFGGGARGVITHVAGNAAVANTGAGGSGACALNTNADLQGGTGGSGQIVITEYF